VLLVDDEPLVREVVSRTLRDVGYVVLEASNGFDAIRIASEPATERIGLLITDVMMPLMRGDDLAKKVRLIHPDVKVIFVTGYGEDSVVGSQKTHTETILEKPFAPSVLVSKIRELLDGA
jgi:CheY-like chemotaxis protein